MGLTRHTDITAADRFNPQLADKPRVLAVSKSDMLDDELMEEIAKTLPEGIPSVFISAVTGQGLTELKDILWAAIVDDRNRIEPLPITHRPLDVRHRVQEEDDFIFEPTPVDDDEFIEDEDWDEIGWEYGDDMTPDSDDMPESGEDTDTK